MQVVEPRDWFRETRIDSYVTMIEQRHVDELVDANIWHIRGRDQDVVIDSGLGVVALRRAIPWLFEREPLLILTHAHLDHAGGAHEFGSVIVHTAERDLLRGPQQASLNIRRELDLLGLDVSDAVAEDGLLVGALPSADYDIAGFCVRAVPNAVSIDGGHRVQLGDRELTVLHLPGHTAGSVAVLDAEQGVLFSGDVLYEGELIDACIGSDARAYRESMERVLDFDIERTLPGHGRPLNRTETVDIARQYLRGNRD